MYVWVRVCDCVCDCVCVYVCVCVFVCDLNTRCIPPRVCVGGAVNVHASSSTTHTWKHLMKLQCGMDEFRYVSDVMWNSHAIIDSRSWFSFSQSEIHLTNTFFLWVVSLPLLTALEIEFDSLSVYLSVSSFKRSFVHLFVCSYVVTWIGGSLDNLTFFVYLWK